MRLILPALGDLVLPRVCVVCGRKLLLWEKHICYTCLADLPLTHFWQVEHNAMADKFNEKVSAVTIDGEHESYARAAALFHYNSESEYKNIPWDLKYMHNLRQGRYFADLLGKELAGSEQFSDVDTVIPVPLHWSRKMKRGYNQAEVIARRIARQLNAAILPRALSRTRRTVTQTKTGMAGKEDNVKGAFSLSGNAVAALADSMHILLVDDTFTTGSTLAACFAALRKELPTSVRISCATLDYVTEN